MTHHSYSNNDLRVQRTRKFIQDAFIDLTITKGFGAVTVRDITTYAKINRATFYRHYQDKFDLVDQYAQDIYRLLDDPASDDSTDNLSRGLVQLFEQIHAHARFFRVMLGKNGDPAFAERIRYYIEKRIRSALSVTLLQDKVASDVYLNYVSAGSTRIVLWWLEHDMPYSSVELAALSYRLCSSGLDAVLGGE